MQLKSTFGAGFGGYLGCIWNYFALFVCTKGLTKDLGHHWAVSVQFAPETCYFLVWGAWQWEMEFGFVDSRQLLFVNSEVPRGNVTSFERAFTEQWSFSLFQSGGGGLFRVWVIFLQFLIFLSVLSINVVLYLLQVCLSLSATKHSPRAQRYTCHSSFGEIIVDRDI